MIIALVYLAVLASVPLARGRLTALADLPLRRPSLAVAAIVHPGRRHLAAPGRRSHDPHDAPHGVLRPARRVRVRQPAHRRRPDHRRVGGAAATSSRSRPTAASCRPTRTRSPRSAHTTAEGDFANSQILAHPKLLFLGDVFATPASLAAAQRLQHRRHDPRDRRRRARPRGVRLAPRPAALPAPSRRRGLMFRGGTGRGSARGASSPRTPSRASAPASPTSRCRCWPTTASARRVGGLGRPAAGPAAGDRPRPAARRAGRPRRLAHAARRRRRPALPRRSCS